TQATSLVPFRPPPRACRLRRRCARSPPRARAAPHGPHIRQLSVRAGRPWRRLPRPSRLTTLLGVPRVLAGPFALKNAFRTPTQRARLPLRREAPLAHRQPKHRRVRHLPRPERTRRWPGRAAPRRPRSRSERRQAVLALLSPDIRERG